MRAIAVVEPGVFCFDGDKIAVEKTDFHAHFLYEVQGEMRGERRRIIVPRAREQMSVQQMGDGSLAAHFLGCGSGRALGWGGGRMQFAEVGGCGAAV